LEEGAHHKYLERAKVPVEALASLAAEDCSIAAAAAVVAVVAPAAAVGVVDVAADVVAAAALVVVAELAAAVGPAAVGPAAEAQESGDFVADHHFPQTWLWEMGEG
jgi:methenyltetrahydromethanopterin cyclohydrolase